MGLEKSLLESVHIFEPVTELAVSHVTVVQCTIDIYPCC